ncbi:ABC transporter ATP-binding protein [uncultured Enterovirga sp.]|uniref:ABC transporter ATP-binding protein n=1 Tax=uncultured Enterovirga sp. TaxID=2026352 RepID=UPI0035CB968C
MSAFLSVRDLRKTYPVARGLFGRPEPLHAVAGISFDIPAGTTFGLVGESGSGKTTTAKMIMAAEDPTSGQIVVDGQDITTHKPTERFAFRRLLQPVLQDPYSALSPRMRIGRIIDEPLRIHRTHRDKASRESRVAELLDAVGLPRNAADRFPNEMSGGQRQRVAIARALSLEPRLMVLDEPVSALDVSIQAQILNLLRDLQDRLGLTYLLISHDLAVIGFMSTQIGVLYLGRFVEVGPKAALLTDARHPYSLALIAAATPHSRVPPVSGEIPSPLAPPPGCQFHTRCPLARDRCRSEPPSLRTIAPGHLVACHYAETTRRETEDA